ncbi:leucine efflux protein LeuE [Phytobacter diazotrophicus]|jgi:leucine efflux protein|uniref:Leucine efflux protein n=1 Tax=Phytobacter diazotrophicus TaxID=395631 RepID=A0ABN6LNG9_9ENTR|nr:leucine efflux protein [Phytobacter diazotrophicus]BEG87571.1 leucine efflux protein LeuE [Phytobacter diazotrophicus]SLK15079.1 leucine efflux protein [Enterobacter sp. NFR05]
MENLCPLRRAFCVFLRFSFSAGSCSIGRSSALTVFAGGKVFAEYGVISFWSYFIGAIFIILVPGPNTFFVLKTSVAGGLKNGYVAAAGVFIGDAVLMFLAYMGVATLIKTTPVLFNLVRYLGAFYLLWLGVKMLYSALSRKGKSVSEHEVHKGDIFKRSLVLSLTNPKAILFYVSFFVQFIDIHYTNTGMAFFILASTLELISVCYFSFLIISGSYVTQFVKTKKRLAKLGNSLIGLIFVGFAARLATLQS